MIRMRSFEPSFCPMMPLNGWSSATSAVAGMKASPPWSGEKPILHGEYVYPTQVIHA